MGLGPCVREKMERVRPEMIPSDSTTWDDCTSSLDWQSLRQGPKGRKEIIGVEDITLACIAASNTCGPKGHVAPKAMWTRKTSGCEK